jgi:hypothetical protein
MRSRLSVVVMGAFEPGAEIDVRRGEYGPHPINLGERLVNLRPRIPQHVAAILVDRLGRVGQLVDDASRVVV